ncbi:class I SAM-dependent methyltransferase [Clostridium sp. ZBS15]|uniref:methyltransferase domain-containing protein n=1 Tax=Clostridium sp. ZBS15 TaxID=2949969 RepID=UPI00207A79C2
MDKYKLVNRNVYLKNKYKKSFESNGYSPEAVLWTKEKQFIRFENLINSFSIEGKSILDIGCGFGDLNKLLKEQNNNYNYCGLDIVEEFINVAEKKYGNSHVKFECCDFLNKDFDEKYDYIVESGIFNIKSSEIDNLELIHNTIEKAMDMCKEAIAFNFLTERVNFKDKDFYYVNPEKILNIAYKYSKKVVLKSDYLPFDYTVVIYKNDSYDQTGIFNTLRNRRV